MVGTLVLANDSYFPGNFPANNPAAITSPVYDPATARVYIADTDTDNITVLDPSTGAFVANYPTGTTNFSATSPTGMALDSSNGDLYIANSGNSSVLVWDPRTLAPVATIPVANGTNTLAYDPRDGDLFVTAPAGVTVVSVINATTNRVVATVPVGVSPQAIAVDTHTGSVFVGNYGSSNVSVLNATSFAVNRTIPLAASDAPSAACFDPVTNEILVTSGALGIVTVLNASIGAVVANITVAPALAHANLDAIAFDSTNHAVYTADAVGRVVNVLNVSARTVRTNISVGGEPSGVAFDPVQNTLYSTNLLTENVSVIDPVTNRVVASPRLSTSPWGVAFDPTNRDLFVSNSTSYGEEGLGTVMSVNTSTPRVGTISGFGFAPSAPPLGYGTYDETYDPANGRLYVLLSVYDGANATTYEALGVVDGRTGTRISVLPLEYGLSCLAFDTANQVVYVGAGSPSGGYLLGFNSTDALVSQLPLNASPQGVAFDPANGDLYLTASVGAVGELIAVDPITNKTVAMYSPDPTFTATRTVVYDSVTAEIFAGNDLNGLAVLNATTGRWVGNVTGVGFTGPAVFDQANGLIYTTEAGTNDVAAINGSALTTVATIPVGIEPEGIAMNGSGETLYVANLLSGSISTISLGASPPPTLSTVTVTPGTASILPHGNATFTATPSCRGGPCPVGTTYAWTLNNSLGTLSSTNGSTTSFTAGTSGGTAMLHVTAALNGASAYGSAAITVGPVTPGLVSVTISPASVTVVGPNGTVNLTASPSCRGGACPAGTTYLWSLGGALGTLNASSGSRVRFIAAGTTGSTTVTVTASLHGANASASATITVSERSPPPTSGGAFPTGYLEIGLALAAVLALGLYLRKFRKWKEKPPASAPGPPGPYRIIY